MRHGLGYRVFRESHTYGIHSLTFELLNGDASKPTCSFHWQCNIDKSDQSWYAFHFQIERRGLTELSESAALVRRILRKMDREPGPEDILGKLGRLGILQVVYDSRVHELVPIGLVAAPEYQLYLEVVPSERWSHVSCLAQNTEEAQRLLSVRLAEGNYDEVLVKWIKNGKQVRRADDCRAPDTTPAMEIIA
ncbi:MAG: hypothetical protein E3J82_01465 [Candidatus Thorarchaeota archaeon]|nr:MAG: hypothetical protein E3J82_01465 [Candidatus Thorarchaeota archaeon]